MNEMTTGRSLAALMGGALLVAALGGGAGWMLRGPGSVPAPQAVLAPADPAAAVTAAPVTAPTAAALAPAAEKPADEVPPPPRTEASRPAPVLHQPVQRGAAPAPAAPAVPARPPVQAAPPVEPMVAQAPAVQPAPVCRRCGVVESVQTVTRPGAANGVGAVAGGVLGGVLGHQVGGGTGRQVATVLGAVGGGFAGHEIEKRVRSETVYELRVRMDDGSVRRFSQSQPLAAGTRVVEDGGRLRVQ